MAFLPSTPQASLGPWGPGSTLATVLRSGYYGAVRRAWLYVTTVGLCDHVAAGGHQPRPWGCGGSQRPEHSPDLLPTKQSRGCSALASGAHTALRGTRAPWGAWAWLPQRARRPVSAVPHRPASWRAGANLNVKVSRQRGFPGGLGPRSAGLQSLVLPRPSPPPSPSTGSTHSVGWRDPVPPSQSSLH